MADSFITLGTRVDNASLQQSLRQINAAMTSIEKRKVNLSLDSGKFTRPLGKITGATNEFTKSFIGLCFILSLPVNITLHLQYLIINGNKNLIVGDLSFCKSDDKPKKNINDINILSK